MKKYILFVISVFCCFFTFTPAQIDTGRCITNNAAWTVDTLIKPSDSIIIGTASYYSRSLEGTKTSSGEKFHHHLYTAASNHFKLGTMVKVTNMQNNKYVVVRINDRMHSRMHKKGRVIDLPINAAKELDFIKAGLTKVKVEIIDTSCKKQIDTSCNLNLPLKKN